MKTREIKEELDRELDEATPNLNEKKVKSHKIKLIDDDTLAAHKKMNNLKWLTASILLIVFAVACVLVITTLVNLGEQTGGQQKKTEVTSYIVSGVIGERVHIITQNGLVIERFALDDSAIGYLEYDESVMNYEGMEVSQYIYNLILVMANGSMQNPVPITLQAINNSSEKTNEELQSIKDEITILNVGESKKIDLKTQAIKYAEYNGIIHLVAYIDDLDSQLEILLANQVKEAEDD